MNRLLIGKSALTFGQEEYTYYVLVVRMKLGHVTWCLKLHYPQSAGVCEIPEDHPPILSCTENISTAS